MPKINTLVFQRLRFILVQTSHPGNIGAVARAMKTMGFAQLTLVAPRFEDALTQPEAIAFASGAQDVLANAHVVGSFEEAIKGCQFAAAVSARLREFSPPVLSPRQLAAHVLQLMASAPDAPPAPACAPAATAGRDDAREGSNAANGDAQDGAAEANGQDVALVFGSERYGLPNEIVEKCNALISIPANPDYSSLNLAQAVQILAYECRMAAEGDGVAVDIGFHGQLASREQVEGMFLHLQQALVAIEFLDADNPKKLMPRLRRLFGRTQLEVEEVNILRGLASQILQPRARIKRS